MACSGSVASATTSSVSEEEAGGGALFERLLGWCFSCLQEPAALGRAGWCAGALNRLKFRGEALLRSLLDVRYGTVALCWGLRYRGLCYRGLWGGGYLSHNISWV